MSNTSLTSQGPKFQIESEKAFIVLGHSERRATGRLLAESLDERKIFDDIDVITLNRSAAIIGRKALREELKNRTVITHSAGNTRIRAARQIIAINPPEHVGLINLLLAAKDIANDPITKEAGAHKTGFLDLAGAGVELLRSPVSTVNTMGLIAGGYSSVYDLTLGANRFPAGRAIVHSDLDGYGFAQLADLDRANNAGITTLILPGTYHNELLFAPNKLLDLMSPSIFPEQTQQIN